MLWAILRPKLSTVPDETSPVRDCGRIHACATVIIAIRRHCPTGLVPYNCWCWLESVCGLHWPATGSRRRTEPSASRKIAFLSDGVNLRVNCGRIVRRNRQCSGQGVSIGGATTVIWDCTVRFRHWWRCASRTTQCFTHGWPVLHFAYNFVSCVVRTRWGFFSWSMHPPEQTCEPRRLYFDVVRGGIRRIVRPLLLSSSFVSQGSNVIRCFTVLQTPAQAASARWNTQGGIVSSAQTGNVARRITA